ncbi:hypothetical protein EC80566_2625 [Escherichia coli 8.0566]|nr:hypothetical protein EC80566_2625 [Escherichia coli 8.0566]EKK44512.1 hypothetical protein EC80569_2637 [Escherichia coli 8.0569]
MAFILAGGQCVGFRDGVLNERTAPHGLGLADLGPNPFHPSRAAPGQFGGLVDAVT